MHQASEFQLQLTVETHRMNGGVVAMWVGGGKAQVSKHVVAQTVKRLPATQDTQVRSLDPEDSLEKEMAAHPSTLAWKSPWTEEPGGLQSMGSERVRQD